MCPLKRCGLDGRKGGRDANGSQSWQADVNHALLSRIGRMVWPAEYMWHSRSLQEGTKLNAWMQAGVSQPAGEGVGPVAMASYW
jgi:hypothetical protein